MGFSIFEVMEAAPYKAYYESSAGLIEILANDKGVTSV